jgi:hypothetical protein
MRRHPLESELHQFLAIIEEAQNHRVPPSVGELAAQKANITRREALRANREYNLIKRTGDVRLNASHYSSNIQRSISCQHVSTFLGCDHDVIHTVRFTVSPQIVRMTTFLNKLFLDILY